MEKLLTTERLAYRYHWKTINHKSIWEREIPDWLMVGSAIASFAIFIILLITL